MHALTRDVIATLFGLCLAASGAVLSVHAAYEIEMIPGGDQVFGDFVVGPTKIELPVEPGMEKIVELVVTNRMGEPRIFNLDIEDMKGSDNPEETVVLLGDDRGPYSLRDYLSFPEASFELAQGERARIPVTVSIPADAEPGGLYGTVLVTTTSVPKDTVDDTSGARSGAVIVSRIGALFFVTVPGEVLKEGSLTGFSTIPEGKSIWSSGPIRFQLLFENTSSVHLSPFGSIRIKNILGEEIGLVEVDPWFAMPQSLRRREVSFDRAHLFGYYTAEASIDRGYGGVVDTKQVSFIVIPWMLLVVAFGGLMLVFFVLRYVFRNFEIKKR